MLVHQEARVSKACLIDLGSTSVGGLDGGQPMMAMRFLDDGWDFSEAERFIVITHAHADRVGDASREINARFGRFEEATVFAGIPIRDGNRERLDSVLDRLRPSRLHMLPNAEDNRDATMVEVWTQPVTADLRMVLKVLVPSAASVEAANDENMASLGTWMSIENRSGRRLFSYLSMGDMSPQNPSVASLLDQIPPRVDLLKFPHHMSDENYFPDFERLVGRNTVVVSSGYSGGALSPMALLSQGAPPRMIVFSVADKGVRELEAAAATRQRWQTYAQHCGASVVYAKSVAATIACQDSQVAQAKLTGETVPALDPGQTSAWAQTTDLTVDLL